MQIPFNKTFIPTESISNVQKALLSQHTQGDGFYGKKCENFITHNLNANKVFLTTSCTQALEFASILLDLNPGDEVILPSFTFTSAATALINIGVTPIFVDIKLDDINIDVDQIEDVISPRTRAISFLNYGGIPADIDRLEKLRDKYNLFLIEDNAHGLGGNYKGKALGSFGDVATLSFHQTKNFQCGEGGALIVNNDRLIERAEILREKGTDRSKFLKGEVHKYQWYDKGGSYILSEILSAYLYGQFENFEFIQKSRETSTINYLNSFKNITDERIHFNPIIKGSAFHNFWMLVPDRNSFINFMGKRGIHVNAHYQSLYHSVAGKKYSKSIRPLHNSIVASENLVRLPLFNNLSDLESEYIVKNVKEFFSI